MPSGTVMEFIMASCSPLTYSPSASGGSIVCVGMCVPACFATAAPTSDPAAIPGCDFDENVGTEPNPTATASGS